MLPYIFYASVVILGALFLSQLVREKFPVARIARALWYISLAAVFVLLIYYSWGQYSFWKSDEFGRGFLPPYQPISYFLGFVLGRFWSWYIFSAAIALLFLWAIKKLNQRGSERFFYDEEPHCIAAALFLVGHPLWIAYAAASLVLYLFFSLGYRLAVRSAAPRTSFYYGWIPLAILVVIFSSALLKIPFLEILIFAKLPL